MKILVIIMALVLTGCCDESKDKPKSETMPWYGIGEMVCIADAKAVVNTISGSEIMVVFTNGERTWMDRRAVRKCQ